MAPDAPLTLDRILAAAEDVAKSSKNGVTVTELAKRLKIDPARAEDLLTQLAVHDRTRIDVGDDAQVRYSVAPEGDIIDDEFREEAPKEMKSTR